MNNKFTNLHVHSRSNSLVNNILHLILILIAARKRYIGDCIHEIFATRRMANLYI